MFTGIEGRIIEKYFVTSSKNNYELIKNAIVKDDSKLLNIPHYEKYLGKEKFKEFFSLPAFRSGFDETEFKNVIFNGCYPLNPIAAYPGEIRKLIYTTNSIENFNRQLRKVTKSKTIFPTDDSLFKILYLAMTDITKKWTGKTWDWGQTLDQLCIYFGDRIQPEDLE